MIRRVSSPRTWVDNRRASRLLEPSKASIRRRAEFRFDGQSAEYRHGPIAPMSFKWPSDADGGRNYLVLEKMAGRPVELNAIPGPWSLFRLFDLMQTEYLSGRDVMVLKATQRPARIYLLLAQRTLNPFDLKVLAQLPHAGAAPSNAPRPGAARRARIARSARATRMPSWTARIAGSGGGRRWHGRAPGRRPGQPDDRHQPGELAGPGRIRRAPERDVARRPAPTTGAWARNSPSAPNAATVIIGSTVVALVVEGSRAAWVVGSASRSCCYPWRGQRLYQLSRDHSLVPRGADWSTNGGWISSRPAPIPRRALTRAVGASEQLVLTCLNWRCIPDVFLLCSDGSRTAERRCAGRVEPGIAAGGGGAAVFDGALSGAARDNLTAVVIRHERVRCRRWESLARRSGGANLTYFAFAAPGSPGADLPAAGCLVRCRTAFWTLNWSDAGVGGMGHGIPCSGTCSMSSSATSLAEAAQRTGRRVTRRQRLAYEASSP